MSNTVQALIDQLELIKPKLDALIAAASGFQSTHGLDEAFEIHTSFTAAKEAVELATPLAVNVEGPVSVDDGKRILGNIKDLQVSWSIVLSNATEKKPLFAAIQGRDVCALVLQDLKGYVNAVSGLAKGCVEAVPADLQEGAKAGRKEFEDSTNKVIALYE